MKLPTESGSTWLQIEDTHCDMVQMCLNYDKCLAAQCSSFVSIAVDIHDQKQVEKKRGLFC